MSDTNLYAAYSGYRGDLIDHPFHPTTDPQPQALYDVDLDAVVYDVRPERRTALGWFYVPSSQGMYLTTRRDNGVDDRMIRETRNGYPYIGRMTYAAANALASNRGWPEYSMPNNF